MLRFSTRLAAVLFLALPALAQAHSVTAYATIETPSSLPDAAPGHLVVLYRNGIAPQADAMLHAAGALAFHHSPHLGLSSLRVLPGQELQVMASLRQNPAVALVLHDRFVSGHALLLRSRTLSHAPPHPDAHTLAFPAPQPQSLTAAPGTLGDANTLPVRTGPQLDSTPTNPTDTLYNSPQGWAVRQAGGFGNSIPGGASTGPWNTTRGAGVRIAILDTGIDAHHPDLAPNLALNLSEIDPSAQPSPCDDASPQDQQGHGTWVASLAAAALGTGTGQTIGVAPQATLLNIKVLQRLPDPTLANPTAACEAGQAGGLMSWVLQGIDDAVANHADIISLSLGSIVDLSTGDGAGWKTAFDRATYAAAQAGAVIVAAAGNDGLNLSDPSSAGRYIELPAQSRSVLAVVASTNPACAEDLSSNATCHPGPILRPYYSNYGATLNALAAPGGSYPQGSPTAETGWIRGACSQGLPNTADGLPARSGQSFGCFGLGHTAYVQAMGTSASAALVAGAAALLHAARPNLSPADILTVLRASGATSSALAEPTLNLPAALLFPAP